MPTSPLSPPPSWSFRAFFLSLVGISLLACGGGSDSGNEGSNADGGTANCSVGELGCACTAGGGCDPGLDCGANDQCEMPSECVCNGDDSCTRSCACDTDCEDPPENCLVKQYDGYAQAGGTNCGSDGNAIPCGDQTYEAFAQAGGPNCGSDGSAYAECKPGDSCVDEVAGSCN